MGTYRLVRLHPGVNMLSKLSLLAFTGAVLAQTNDAPSLAQALNSSSELSSLSGILATPGLAQLVQSLSSERNITILAPSNEAFASVGAEALKSLTSNEDCSLLSYNITC